MPIDNHTPTELFLRKEITLVSKAKMQIVVDKDSVTFQELGPQGGTSGKCALRFKVQDWAQMRDSADALFAAIADVTTKLTATGR